MSRRPLVHIGYHKTATTWFQRQFYPRVANARYIPQIDVIRAFKAYDMLAPDDAALREALGMSGELPVILCDETLCGSFRGTHLRSSMGWSTSNVLATALPDAEIVIFVRAQQSMLAATYAEYVRGGGTRSPAALFGLETVAPSQSLRIASIPSPHIAHFDYDRLISRYDTLFGPDRVHVFLYEDFMRDPQAFLRRYVARLGLDIDVDGVGLSRENMSYRRGVMGVARLLNHMGQAEGGHPVPMNIPGMFRLSRRFLHRLNHVARAAPAPSPADLFGAEMLAWIEQRFAPGNRRLAGLRDLQLAENGYPL